MNLTAAATLSQRRSIISPFLAAGCLALGSFTSSTATGNSGTKSYQKSPVFAASGNYEIQTNTDFGLNSTVSLKLLRSKFLF